MGVDPRAVPVSRLVEGVAFTRVSRGLWRGELRGEAVVARKKPRGHWRWAIHPEAEHGTYKFPSIRGRGTTMKEAVRAALSSRQCR